MPLTVSSLLMGLAAAAPLSGPVTLAQMTIEQRVIIRVPTTRAPGRVASTAAPKVEWEEKKGPKCVPIGSIVGATIATPTGVDLLMAGSKRYRARLQKGCRSASFWSGFYVEPTEDGTLCAGRDSIQARNGMSCEVDDFRKLVVREDD